MAKNLFSIFEIRLSYLKENTKLYFSFSLLIGLLFGLLKCQNSNQIESISIGQPIDKFNGVSVYYNGSVGHIKGRNTTADGYNLGLKYQCVEFAKRYYYEYFKHKMPNSYGHAKDFYNKSLRDGQKNSDRNLYQYSNSSSSKPKINDIIIFDGTVFNQYGHIAIISNVTHDEIEIIQQNPGPSGSSRAKYDLDYHQGKWIIKNNTVLGRLRK